MPRCYKCNSPFHYSNKCTERSTEPLNSSYNKWPEPISCPRQLKVEFGNRWGRKSVLIKTDSDLDQLKKRFTDVLSIHNHITATDMDERNKTSHIELGSDEKEYETAFNQINNRVLNVDVKDFNVKVDSVELNIDNKHFTLFFKRGLFRNIDTYSLISETLQQFIPSYKE